MFLQVRPFWRLRLSASSGCSSRFCWLWVSECSFILIQWSWTLTGGNPPIFRVCAALTGHSGQSVCLMSEQFNMPYNISHSDLLLSADWSRWSGNRKCCRETSCVFWWQNSVSRLSLSLSDQWLSLISVDGYSQSKPTIHIQLHSASIHF